MKLEDKVAVVTGGSSGIGLATAKLFKEHGARVVILGQNQTKLDEACALIGGDTLAIQANVARVADLESAYAVIAQKRGRIDVLFANAGISHCPPIEETSEADFDHIVGINLKGAFFTVTKALPLLSENASVILTSSAAQDMGRLGDPLYAATKAAVRSLVRTLAVQEAIVAKKLRVNAVTPGCVKTPLTEAAAMNADVTAYLESLIPLKRWGEADEIANAVLFLASSESSYMTASEIAVDGGLAQV